MRSHRKQRRRAAIELWQPAAAADRAPATTFVVTRRLRQALRDLPPKFDNAVNFRGFPHMPGNDFALTLCRRGDANDGARCR